MTNENNTTPRIGRSIDNRENTCIVCGIVYRIKKANRLLTSKYCSRVCFHKDLKNKLCGNNNPNYKNGISENTIKKTCEFCEKDFFVTKYREDTAKTCSRLCANRLNAKNAKKEKEKTEKITYLPHSNLYPAKKCGHLTKKGRSFCYLCTTRGNAKQKSNCIVCGGVIVHYKKRPKKTCSKKCHLKNLSLRQQGNKSHLWKGGLTSNSMKIRNSAEYQQWRSDVFSRDNYTCTSCKKVGGELTADHILPFSLYPALRLDVSNGRTLCRECHSKLPTTGINLINLMNKQKKKLGGIQLGLI